MSTRSKVAELNPFPELEEATYVQFDGENSTHYFAVGSSRGKVSLYDLRYPIPLQKFTHQYKLPI